MNKCSGCGKDFRSVTSFDRHRVGKFNVPNDRRCLSTDGMVAKGFHSNHKGTWSFGTFKMKGRKAA